MSPLTFEERGAYNSLLDILYACDGILPDNDHAVAKMMTCQKRTWVKFKARLIQLGKVWVTDGKIHAKRVEKELNSARIVSEKQSNNASIRWQKDKSASKTNGHAMPPGNAYTTTSTSTTRKKEKKESLSDVNGYEVQFAKVWSIYPRKQKQGPARVEFYKAIKATPVETMIAAIERAKPGWESNDPKYTPQLVIGLKDRRWLDELPIAPPAPRFRTPR